MAKDSKPSKPEGERDYFADELLGELDETPSLTTMYKAQDYSARVGFDFKNIDIVMGKVKEELAEVEEAFEAREDDFEHYREEIGDAFFVLVNLARHSGIDPEQLGKENAEKYLKRCQFIEEKLREEGRSWEDMSLDEIYATWKEAKKAGL